MPLMDGSLIPQFIGGGVAPVTGDGSPVGVVTPDQEGQVYVDTTADTAYIAVGTTNADWDEVGAGSTPQQNAGNPNGTVVPSFIGAICVDTTNNIAYINVDNTNTGWKAAAA